MKQLPILELSDVSKHFDSTQGRNVVLRDVNLRIYAGQKVSIVGASGSGKSTLLSLITGLLRPDTGIVTIKGTDIQQLNDDERSKLRSKNIGIALQSENLIPFLTALENVKLALSFAKRRVSPNYALELLERMKVAHLATYRPRQVSGGEAQRISLAVAIANKPQILIADEMVAQLDEVTAGRVVDDIFASDMAVLFVTHNRQLADRAERKFSVQDKTVVEL